MVTGAAGFIGSHTAVALLARGDRVVGLDNMNDYYDPARKRSNVEEIRATPGAAERFTFVEGDIRNRELVAGLFAQHGFTAIAHLAAMAGVRVSVEDPWLYYDVNLTGTLNLLDAARLHGKPNFVLASTSSAYGNTTQVPFIETDSADRPLAPYPASKRSAELLGRDDVAERVRRLYQAGPDPLADNAGRKALRVISCHLGGSSSVTGIRDGVAIGTSMGLSPQSGLPQNNRVGDLDSAAIPFVVKTLGLSLSEVERQMTKESGLLGLSGVGNDLRDILAAAGQGNARARLAIDVLVHSTRHWIGAFLLELGGCDALVFTAGIGENNPDLRAAICAGLTDLGLGLDSAKNNALRGEEGEISAVGSRTRVLVIPANEELVVARETRRCVAAQN